MRSAINQHPQSGGGVSSSFFNHNSWGMLVARAALTICSAGIDGCGWI